MPRNEMLEAIKFDRKKPHGIVFPPHDGAHYEQGGLHFDNEGNVVESLLTDEDRKRLDRLAKQRAADKVADEARAAFLKEQGISEEEVRADPVAAVTKIAQAGAVDASEVDLIGWARGTVKYHFFTVRAAFEKQHHYTATDKKAAIDWLIDNELISEDEAKA